MFGIDVCFDAIYGVNPTDTLSKSDLLKMCMDELKANKMETILVGDSVHDAVGAKQARIDFHGVTYGFGFE